MAIIGNNILTQQEDQPQTAPVAQPSWIKDLIDKRYQPQTERLKRNPVGFNFTREPFDPSSYYRSLQTYKNINVAATNVVNQEVQNRDEAEREAAFNASQKASQGALGGVGAKFTYDNKGKSLKYHLGKVSTNTAAAADYFGNKFGIKTVYGFGAGSVPGSDHPKGRALDYMIKSRSQGTALANDVIKNASKWKIKYVIWNRYIWNPQQGWHHYSGKNPHTDHVHVSFLK